MRGFGSICVIILVLAFAGMARAANSTIPSDQVVTEQTAALAAVNPSATGGSIRAVVTGLRQTIVDNGLSQALNHASDWVKELEVSWTAHLNGQTAFGFNTGDADSGLDTTSATAALAAKEASFTSRPYAIDLGIVTFGTGGAENEVWQLGHARPLAALVATNNVTAPGFEDHGLINNTAAAVTSRDVQLGVRLPLLPWSATVAGDHYWWGAPGFGQKVEGTRVGLKLSPVQNVEIEGGHAEDTRGNGGFVGVLYRLPLDQPK